MMLLGSRSHRKSACNDTTRLAIPLPTHYPPPRQSKNPPLKEKMSWPERSTMATRLRILTQRE